MRRWIADDQEIRPGVYIDLLRLVEERAQDLDDLVPALKRAAA